MKPGNLLHWRPARPSNSVSSLSEHHVMAVRPCFQKVSAGHEHYINTLWKQILAGTVKLFKYSLGPVTPDCVAKTSANTGAHPAPRQIIWNPAYGQALQPDLFPLPEYPCKILASSQSLASCERLSTSSKLQIFRLKGAFFPWPAWHLLPCVRPLCSYAYEIREFFFF